MGQQQQKGKKAPPPEKWEPPVAPEIGKRKKKKGPDAATRIPKVYPVRACLLRQYRLERCKDYLLLEEEFLKTIDAQRDAQSNLEEGGQSHYEAELQKVNELRGMPLEIGKLEEAIDDSHAIVAIQGSEYYVPMLSFVDKERLELGCSVLLHNRTHAMVGILEDDTDPMVSVMKVEKAPTDTYADIGGLESQIQEIKEAVEFPLSHPELYDEIGIKPPKGVILYGVPGTGKTLLAKAVANQTSATFLRVVGSELIQKYSGEGPKLVRELFRVAEENSPAIVFIDEIDAIGTKRYDTDSSGTKEVQRTMLELLTQLDGFDSSNDVKVIMATNRIDTLDPALIRPGRIDRKIEFPFPDEKTKKMIFEIHTSRMSLAEDVDITEFIHSKDEMSGADIKAICTEAGLLALRDRRMKVCQDDFVKGKENVQYRKDKSSFSRFYL
ncbi:26S proteasome regulatory subunit T2 [Angomonas deanei]|uniref:26S proteasome regulatory subunit 4 homolog n=1 Tax=Angomonas deanei TaxID=59799 RepID=S9WEN3_9TRYP|nr:26S proteasome regulatory subunit T2 [Angomonas deanei]EPY37616.1 26S proteasome regulatory subunit T2 [Angomonas deanei]EPY39660.1 26S proteasome regulatory subunit T2 [Angomonas deanei]EPY43415.1 26S proteasome regulatory subunit T2 [Angomonas deanei]CAD2219623.1 Proteasomal ATPase OB C-terminal domain/AAA domain (dynein-related subfamily)/ATPase family associated with various cellular activities (AAA)/AAA domain (Cdc48 subfamily)/AAA+ lid domain containing protein, putative [Angomonas dea|eukprot:EPY30815.1 26S proteasome regulatory subunit T2 [Angomonas deanei]